MATALSVLFALGAAALFGASSVLQQAAARQEGDLPVVGLRVLLRLVRRPRWVLAVSLAGISFGVQAVALAFGPLALVQPLAATDILFALPLLAHRQRRPLPLRDVGAAGMVVAGIVGFLTVSPPSAGAVSAALARWGAVLAGAGAAMTLLVALATGARGTRRTALLAAAGGVVFALGDALTKAVVGLVDARGAGALISPEAFALLVTGVTGMVLAQGAYRAGSLLTSLPIIDTVEPVGAVVIGAAAFGEHLGGSPALWSAQLGAGAVAVVGIVLLDRSPLLSSTPGGGRRPGDGIGRTRPGKGHGPADTGARTATDGPGRAAGTGGVS